MRFLMTTNTIVCGFAGGLIKDTGGPLALAIAAWVIALISLGFVLFWRGDRTGVMRPGSHRSDGPQS